ncbi:hypothetical protein PLICRDRAFT_174292 [Plicaturopsis crispa FD-325 SS-3]|nr:hypothetical protein PLICRDRAFT_174292 [Plicaturopsis crispa FD-325 SS-3]
MASGSPPPSTRSHPAASSSAIPAAPPTFLQRWTWSPALLLENTGSVARDHLASERTFLAYVRTSLALSSMGVALTQLFSISFSTTNGDSVSPNASPVQQSPALRRYASPLGAVIILFGISVLALGTSRYFIIQSALTSGKFPAARRSLVVLSMALGTLVVVVFGILIGAKG